jgi:hypothetical protein
MAAAIHRDLSDVTYTSTVSEYTNGSFVRKPILKNRRPNNWELSVIMFPQTWSDTSLGYGGVAGQAFTTDYTIIISYNATESCVYFGSSGALAYKINHREQSPEGRKQWEKDISCQEMAAVHTFEKYI